MRFLFIMDPLSKLDLQWDTSLTFVTGLCERRHETWTADSSEIFREGDRVFAYARTIHPMGKRKFKTGNGSQKSLTEFDAVFIRKDPPFDMNYIYLTLMLDPVAEKIPVVNHPSGLRNVGEKMFIMNFTNFIPESLVTHDPEQILEFQKRLQMDLVIKPLDLKAGDGVFLWKRGQKSTALLTEATKSGAQPLMAQEFLPSNGRAEDKRILILDGKFLAAFVKRAKKGEFRTNLSLGGTYHPTELTQKEKQLTAYVGHHLLKEGILFAGIDVMREKLIEVNVTSPAGILEAQELYPDLDPLRSWTDFASSLPEIWPRVCKFLHR